MNFTKENTPLKLTFQAGDLVEINQEPNFIFIVFQVRGSSYHLRNLRNQSVGWYYNHDLTPVGRERALKYLYGIKMETEILSKALGVPFS
jgi:hypothetical protein